jgi:hypothetical protein
MAACGVLLMVSSGGHVEMQEPVQAAMVVVSAVK